MELRPHPGPQEQFLSTPADIAIYGGSAGGGKTFALLLEPLRHIENPRFGAVIFRRTTPQIRNEGALWDESRTLYTGLAAHPRETYLDWTFPSGCRITLSAMEHEADRFNWDGSQVAYIGFDQLEHFTATQFFYMMSRSRSTSGVVPYIRATANPDPDSFLVEFLRWWLGDDGYPIEERAGVIRWLIRLGDEMIWGDTKEDAMNQALALDDEMDPDDLIPVSVTFIPAKLSDNPTLVKKDPLYRAKLNLLPRIERERLLKGNWHIRYGAGDYFKRDWFHEANRPLDDVISRCRYWDFASTTVTKAKKNPDWTVGTLMSKSRDNNYQIEHVVRVRKTPKGVKALVQSCVDSDPPGTIVGLSQDPGQAGKDQIHTYLELLSGVAVQHRRETGTKETRAKSFSAPCELGNVRIRRGDWNEWFLNELENFPPNDMGHDDCVDSACGAYETLALKSRAGTWGRKDRAKSAANRRRW